MKFIIQIFAITFLLSSLTACYTAAVAGAGAGAGYVIADEAEHNDEHDKDDKAINDK